MRTDPTKLILSVLVCLLASNLHASDDITGKWVRMSQMGPACITFSENGEVEGNSGDDGTIEIRSSFDPEGTEIKFNDKSGSQCPGIGVYRVKLTIHYLSLNYISDDCGGRVKTLMGFWMREGFQDQILELTGKRSSDPTSLLSRGRMYLALGKSKEAKEDFDNYIELPPEEAEVYINRASTCFPFDPGGVVEDGNRAIELEAGKDN